MKYEKAEAKVIYFNNNDAILTGRMSVCGSVSYYGECGTDQISECRRKSAYSDVCRSYGTNWWLCSFDKSYDM